MPSSIQPGCANPQQISILQNDAERTEQGRLNRIARRTNSQWAKDRFGRLAMSMASVQESLESARMDLEECIHERNELDKLIQQHRLEIIRMETRIRFEEDGVVRFDRDGLPLNIHDSVWIIDRQTGDRQQFGAVHGFTSDGILVHIWDGEEQVSIEVPPRYVG